MGYDYRLDEENKFEDEEMKSRLVESIKALKEINLFENSLNVESIETLFTKLRGRALFNIKNARSQ